MEEQKELVKEEDEEEIRFPSKIFIFYLVITINLLIVTTAFIYPSAL